MLSPNHFIRLSGICLLLALFSVSNPSDAAFAGTICNTDITGIFHTRLRDATKGRHGRAVSYNCHNFRTGPTWIKLAARRDGYIVQANLEHVRIGVNDLYTSFMRITLEGQIYSQKEGVIGLGPHFPAGNWESAARKLTRHIGEIYAQQIKRKIRECQKQPRKQTEVSNRTGSSTTRTTRDHRVPEMPCLLDVPIVPKGIVDHRQE